MYTFCKWVHDYVIHVDKEPVHWNLLNCLCEKALTWWLNTVTPDEKVAYFSTSNELTLLTNKLQNHFKLSMTSAFTNLHWAKYTMQDTEHRKKSYLYVQYVERMVLQCSIVREGLICMTIWEELNLKLKKNVTSPTDDTTVQSFTELLESLLKLFYQMTIEKKKWKSKKTQKKKTKNTLSQTQQCSSYTSCPAQESQNFDNNQNFDNQRQNFPCFPPMNQYSMSYDFSDNQSDFGPPVFEQPAYPPQFSPPYQEYSN